jgi:hypothetical protein
MRALLLFISLVFFSCANQTSESGNALPREKFIELLVGMYRIEGKVTGQVIIDDNNQKKFREEYNQLFSSLGTDSLEVRETFEFYKNNTDEMKAIMQEVFNRLGSGK